MLINIFRRCKGSLFRSGRVELQELSEIRYTELQQKMSVVLQWKQASYATLILCSGTQQKILPVGEENI